MAFIPVVDGKTQMAELGSPDIWSPKLLVKFYSACVAGNITNTDYEGVISKQGCKVIIRTTPDVQIRPYTKGMVLTHQQLAPGREELDIDKANYWDFVIDNIDAFQGDINYQNDWTNDAAFQQKVATDVDMLGGVYASAHASNKGATAGLKSGDINLGVAGTPLQFTNVNAIDIITSVRTVLCEQNIPESDCAIVLPYWATQRIKTSDIKDAMLTGDKVSPLRNGRIGKIDDFEIYGSNLLTSVVDGSGVNAWQAIACHKSAISFAAQMTQNQVLPQVESTFGAVCRGLLVYGYKVLKPQALVNLYLRK
jgi:hypothetical protein